MKKLWLASIALGALAAGSAVAADMPVKAPPARVVAATWTGCYVGGNVGAGWARTEFAAANGVDEGSHTGTGIVGGGQVGCDYQFAGNWVVGVQGMFDASNVRGRNASTVFPANTLEERVNRFATVAGTLGFLVTPTVKVYGKAGYGWVNTRFFCTSGSCIDMETTATLRGFDAGGGVSWLIARNWELFVEYDHIFADARTVTFVRASTGATFDERVKQGIDKVLVGVNFRFR